MSWSPALRWVIGNSDEPEPDLFCLNELLYLSGTKGFVTYSGNTILHFAAIGRSPTVLKFLLRNFSFQVNAANADGETPLHWAARRGTSHTIRILLKAGAHVNATDIENFAPLHFAVEVGLLENVISLNVSSTNFNIQSYEGFTPERYAAYLGEPEIQSYLLHASKTASKTCTSTS